MRLKAKKMYRGYVEMFLETISNEHPLDDFCDLYIKKKPDVRYNTAEVKWKVLNAAFEVFVIKE